MDIRALIFDLGQVIVQFDLVELRRVFVRDGTDREMLPTTANNGWPEVIDYECGRISTPDFVRHVGDLIGRELTIEEFDSAWSTIFRLNEPVARLIPMLKRQYPLVLLSNTNDSHWRSIRGAFAETLCQFNQCLLSFELKRMKPDKEVYLAAAKATGQAPEHCLFIDDIESYVEGGRAAGLQAVQYVGTPTNLFLESLISE